MKKQKKRIVVIGATSAIAQNCARLWIKETAVEMMLIGRDIDKTERIAADLRVRSPLSVINAFTVDFLDPAAIRQLVDDLSAAGPISVVLIAHGSLPDQRTCQLNLSSCQDELMVNGVSPVLFAEAFIGKMQEADLGSLAIISSVAGDRGRKSNYVYGAAKGMVTRYAQGLQHRLANSNVKVVLIKPGPTDTPMTTQLKQSGSSLANVGDVAKRIVKGVDKGKPVVYAPAKWWLIMMIIRHLPFFIFNRMNI